MSAIGFVRKALAMGVDLETALKMGEAFEAEMPVYVPPLDQTAAKRREWDRQRKADERAAKKASGGRPPESGRHQADPVDVGRTKDAPAPVHTRGENNLSRLVDTGFAVVAAAEAREPGFDWPAGRAADHAKLLVDVVGNRRLDPSKQQGLVTTTGRLDAWKRDGASWEHDVVPVVTALARKTGPPVNTWKFFDQAIAQSIADNRRALEIPPANGPRHERPDPASTKRASREGNYARAFAGSEAATRSRAVRG